VSAKVAFVMADRPSKAGARLGLFGGTFDPVHTGHLVIAEVARYTLSLDQVIFVPAGDPPHKGEDVTAAEHRYEMALLATAPNEAFVVSRRELERSGPSYSLTTIQEYRREIGPEGALFFIAGVDTVLEIQTWYRWREVLRECRFAALARPGFELSSLLAALPEELRERIDLLPAPALVVSSTELRARAGRGEPIRYLVPEPVEVYIRKHALYQHSS
jgi:nicotinate-nucleotide adenylyltransferase